MDMNKKTDINDTYKQWRDKLLRAIGHEICANCNDPRRLKTRLDIDNPLNCSCHCEQVDAILEKAADINSDIEKNSTRKHIN